MKGVALVLGGLVAGALIGAGWIAWKLGVGFVEGWEKR